jgi:hypothetical protein
LPHALPHVPQLLASDVESLSQPFEASLSQSLKPLLHESTVHVSFTHTSLALLVLHAIPQPPQLLGSLFTSTHDMLLQSMSGAPQVATHLPALHFCPSAQALAHVPQLAGSVCLFVHTNVLPEPHASGSLLGHAHVLFTHA